MTGEAINSCSLLMRWRNKCTRTLLCTTACIRTHLNDTDRCEILTQLTMGSTLSPHTQSLRCLGTQNGPRRSPKDPIVCVEFNEGTCTHPSTSSGRAVTFWCDKILKIHTVSAALWLVAARSLAFKWEKDNTALRRVIPPSQSWQTERKTWIRPRKLWLFLDSYILFMFCPCLFCFIHYIHCDCQWI